MPTQAMSDDTDTLILELTAEIIEGLERLLERHAQFDNWCDSHAGA